MKAKNIAYYLPSATILYYPKHGREIAGGAEMNLYNLAKAMAGDKGYRITFYVSDDGQKNDVIRHGVHVKKVRFLNKEKGKLKAIRRQIALIWQMLLLREEVIITTTASEHLGLLVFIHQTIKKKAVIFRLAHDHNYDLTRYESKGSRFYKLYKYGLMNVKVIVAQTEKQQNALEVLGRTSTVIKNGFAIPEPASVEKKFVLWVARSKKMKRPELLVQLAKLIPEHRFVMIMPTNNNKKSEALAECIQTEAKNMDNLKVISYVDPTEIQAYFDMALLFVNTSTFEGFPNTFIQAGIGQTPLLSFNINPDGMFDSNNIGCCCNDDIDVAVNYIKSLTDSVVKEQGQNMYQYVINNHSIEVACNAYKKLVEAIL